MRYRAQISNQNQLSEALELFEYVYVDMNLAFIRNFSQNLSQAQKNRMILIPPVFITNAGGKTLELIKKAVSNGFRNFLAHTINHVSIFGDFSDSFSEFSEKKVSTYGGCRLNVTNSKSLKVYEELGLEDIAVSIELGLQRAKSLKHAIPLGFLAYGQLSAMLLRNICKSDEVDRLIDRKNKTFPLKFSEIDESESELLNPHTLYLADKMDSFENVFDFAVLNLAPKDSPKEILDLYLNRIPPTKKLGDFTRGLY